jgi:hypothetical protein
MKYIFLAILLLLAVQPLQASLYDMCDVQGTGHSQHGHMDDLDCCDYDPTELSGSCASMSHCGALTADIMAPRAGMPHSGLATKARQYLPGTSEPSSNFNPPPFRPPIG